MVSRVIAKSLHNDPQFILAQALECVNIAETLGDVLHRPLRRPRYQIKQVCGAVTSNRLDVES